ncbi:MAG TPA: SDR family NAD(P)-dependent oxidoreductase [Candidatus Binataceae bacterium]|nr:SDR family NAD(P)-dependent oxidoreductase [Candidatus Binataceae bacterium]
MDQKKQQPVAVIVGIGPGLGAALVRRFAREYRVAMIARSPDYLNQLAGERAGGGNVAAYPADVGREDQVAAAFDKIRRELGSPQLLLYNAGAGPFGAIAEISPEQFENCWRINTFGAFLCAKQVIGEMVARGHGVVLFTGATAGVKAGARSAAFGSAKFALRGLAQSMARDLGPKGIHVAHINVDGVIDIPGRSYAGMKSEDMLKPDAIAETYWHLAHQDRSSWTMELEVRPFKEKF